MCPITLFPIFIPFLFFFDRELQSQGPKSYGDMFHHFTHRTLSASRAHYPYIMRSFFPMMQNLVST